MSLSRVLPLICQILSSLSSVLRPVVDFLGLLPVLTCLSDSLVCSERIATCLTDSLVALERFATRVSNSLIHVERFATCLSDSLVLSSGLLPV